MTDREGVLDYILETLTEDDIFSAIDDQMLLEYIDDDWKEDGEYDSEWEWYQDFGRNEAERDVVHDVVLEASFELKVGLSNDDLEWVMDKIADEFDILIN